MSTDKFQIPKNIRSHIAFASCVILAAHNTYNTIRDFDAYKCNKARGAPIFMDFLSLMFDVLIFIIILYLYAQIFIN
jgi:hypothetical protein